MYKVHRENIKWKVCGNQNKIYRNKHKYIKETKALSYLTSPVPSVARTGAAIIIGVKVPTIPAPTLLVFDSAFI